MTHTSCHHMIWIWGITCISKVSLSSLFFKFNPHCFTLQNITGEVSTKCDLQLPNGCQRTTGCSLRRFLPPLICLLLFISCACIIQQLAHATGPICAVGVGERKWLARQHFLRPVSLPRLWAAWKNRQEHLEYDSPVTQPHLEHNSPSHRSYENTVASWKAA